MIRPALAAISLTSVLCAAGVTAVSDGGRDAPPPPEAPARVVLDLTHALGPDTPAWPEPMFTPFKYQLTATIDKDGFFAGRYQTPDHLGTHVDAPAHFVAGQPTVDLLRPADLVRPAVVIDMEAAVAANVDARLGTDAVRAWERTHGAVPAGSIVLLRTGWASRWPDPLRVFGKDAKGVLHFPGFSQEAAALLVRDRRVVALGIDSPSLDYGPSSDYAVHHLTYAAGRYGIENLADLTRLPATGATVIVAPIKIAGGSGGQARVLALLP